MTHPEGNTMGKYESGKIHELAVSELVHNPDQPRKAYEENDLLNLANSIQEKGLLQPILVKELEDGTITVVSGHRRYLAHQHLKLETIPVWFTDGDPGELALVENLIREDLSHMEVAAALQKLKDKSGNKSQADLAKLIGKAESTVSEILSLNNLTVEIRNKIRGDKRFALRELKKIATEPSPKVQARLFKAYVAKLDAPSKDNKPRRKSKGADLHQKKIEALQGYLTKNTSDDKIQEFTPLREQLIDLKKSINKILDNLDS